MQCEKVKSLTKRQLEEPNAAYTAIVDDNLAELHNLVDMTIHSKFNYSLMF